MARRHYVQNLLRREVIRFWRIRHERSERLFLCAFALVFGLALTAQQVEAEPILTIGDAGVVAGGYPVLVRKGKDGGSELVTLSPDTGSTMDQMSVPEPEYPGVPVLDAWADFVVVGGNGHDPDAFLATLFRVRADGTLSRVRGLSRPDDVPCLSMTFVIEGTNDAPHLTILCQEGGGAVLVSEGDWPEVTLSTAFRFGLAAETVLGTAVVSKAAPRSALVALRGIEGSPGWSLASLTQGDRVSALIDGKSKAPVRVISGTHPRLDRLVLTGGTGLEATIGFDFEGQGGWQFLPPMPGAIALLADTWHNWLAIAWAKPGTELPFARASSQTMHVSLYDLDAIAAEDIRPQRPAVTLEPQSVNRLWLGNETLVLTTASGVFYQPLEELTGNKP